MVLCNLPDILPAADSRGDEMITPLLWKEDSQLLLWEKLEKQHKPRPQVRVSKNDQKQIRLIYRGQLDQPGEDAQCWIPCPPANDSWLSMRSNARATA